MKVLAVLPNETCRRIVGLGRAIGPAGHFFVPEDWNADPPEAWDSRFTFS
ncbi:hypothetical protein [Salinibacter altiplanensis]|nr:hypothetical protein [Salinibacter altiplanensis]